jgi:uncharacterized repeat protein (TIGR03803 family)
LPAAGVIQDVAGNLYGTTPFGGAFGWGVVFKVDPTGHETVLYTFAGGADGGQPFGGLIEDAAGNLYGTTYDGGLHTPNLLDCGAGCGVVYELDPTGHETVLYSFTGGADGASPVAGVIQDAAGNLYGTASEGGVISESCFANLGCGVVLKLDPTGHETVLYTFTGGADGSHPNAGVIRDAAGNSTGLPLTAATPKGPPARV